jgi:bacterioferritin
VPEQFAADLTAEHEMLTLLSEGVTHCAQIADYTTRHMLETMVQDVDEHIDWIETQQELIRQLGLELYLSEQIKKEAS